ncbi:beta family protein [Streptomyces geranii]|uniref:beta family protein n=1 Tax=Streptomyces geranii TaxID=2058923 RepID=UPI000D02C797|nr:beta family protein [Streptomyces geranii]
MSGPLYVPALPVRLHAVASVKDLAPRIRDRTAPLWTLPALTAAGTDELQRTVDKELRRVAAVQKYTPAWLDAPHADLDERAYADLLPSYWSHTALRPVTDPDLPTAHQAVAVESARYGGNGLGIRVRLPGAWNDELAERTAALLARTGPEVRVDLLLDLQTVLPGRPDAGKEALRALDALVPLATWRTIATLAGGFPDEVDRLLDGERGEADRADWDMWHEIRASGRSYAESVRYGDYGTLPARNLDRAADDSDRSRFGLLRYTTERSFPLARFWAENRGETGVTREAARWITEFPDFRGEGASAGDRWYQQCARTTGSKGTGNAGTWNQVGNVQHMTYVVRCLAGGADRP